MPAVGSHSAVVVLSNLYGLWNADGANNDFIVDLQLLLFQISFVLLSVFVRFDIVLTHAWEIMWVL